MSYHTMALVLFIEFQIGIPVSIVAAFLGAA